MAKKINKTDQGSKLLLITVSLHQHGFAVNYEFNFFFLQIKIYDFMGHLKFIFIIKIKCYELDSQKDHIPNSIDEL